MKTKDRMRTMAVSAAGMLLFSGVFLATDAFAQVRAGRVTVPHVSTGVRGGGGAPFASHSGGQGLKSVGGLFGSAGGGYYGHESHHGHYSGAEAFRDVGLANAAVDLVGTLVGGYSYPRYPMVMAPPVAVVPVPAPYPVAVVSGPRVIVGSYPYGYASSYYPYSSCYGYGSPYYYYPSTVWNAPCAYPYGYYDGYGYGKSYCNSPRVYGAPCAPGYYPEHHGPRYHEGSHGRSGPWPSGGGSYNPPGPWQNGHGGAQAPTHHGPSVQAPQSPYHGSAPSPSGSHGGGRSLQPSPAHSPGQSYRIR